MAKRPRLTLAKKKEPSFIQVSFAPESSQRRKARDKWKEATRKKDHRKIREEMARALEREGRRRLFKAMVKKSAAEKKRISQRIFEARLAAVKKLDPDLDDADARAEADRVTILKVSAARLKADRPEFVQVTRGKKKINAWRRSRVVVKRGRKIRVPYGPLLSASRVKRSLSARAYWARVKALADAAGVGVSEARRLNRVLIDVPEGVRRRIYAQIVSRF